VSDWGRGYYERTAAELEPAAVRVVDAAGVAAGERVLDVACGTGNAAVLAADRGAVVAGVDSAARLVEVARSRVDGEFVVGDACALPFDDDAFDVAVSVFGVIFAAPASDAVAELLRVVRPGGRIVLTSWIPRGPLDEMAGLARRAAAEASEGTGPPRTNWGDPDVVRSLFAPRPVEISEQEITFEWESPQAMIDAQLVEHPMWLAIADLLSPEALAELRADSLAVLERENESSDGLRITSPYWLIQCVS